MDNPTFFNLYKLFWTKKIDRVGRGGAKKAKLWPRMGLAFIYFWPRSLLEAPKWVKDPGNGLKSIRGSCLTDWEHGPPLKITDHDFKNFFKFW